MFQLWFSYCPVHLRWVNCFLPKLVVFLWQYDWQMECWICRLHLMEDNVPVSMICSSVPVICCSVSISMLSTSTITWWSFTVFKTRPGSNRMSLFDNFLQYGDSYCWQQNEIRRCGLAPVYVYWKPCKCVANYSSFQQLHIFICTLPYQLEIN